MLIVRCYLAIAVLAKLNLHERTVALVNGGGTDRWCLGTDTTPLNVVSQQ
jgi:hypothetical protein